MLPDDLPDNVIPFRPRQKRDRPRAEERADTPAPVNHPAHIGHIVNGITGQAQPGKRELSSVRGGTLFPAPSAHNSAPAMASMPMPSARAHVVATSAADHPSNRLPSSGEHGGQPGGTAQQGSATSSTMADHRSATDPAATTAASAERAHMASAAVFGNRVAPGQPISPEEPSHMTGKTFSWRRTGLLLAGSFVLGALIAWGAIAIGADIVGVWPHGFAFYVMLIGGGMTMLLTTALMMALFYSDSSGHDDVVQQFRPSPRPAQDLSSEPARKRPGGPQQ
jgi:hypothetical protein